MKKEEAKEIIARVIANYKGTLAEHQAIQEAFRALTERMRITSKGNVTVGNAALATSATDGFFYIPTCAGTPSGTPTAGTEGEIVRYNNKWYGKTVDSGTNTNWSAFN